MVNDNDAIMPIELKSVLYDKNKAYELSKYYYKEYKNNERYKGIEIEVGIFKWKVKKIAIVI